MNKYGSALREMRLAAQQRIQLSCKYGQANIDITCTVH